MRFSDWSSDVCSTDLGVRPCYQFSSRRELLVGLRRLDVSRDRAAGVERRRALYGKSEDGRQLQRRGDAWNICIEPGSAPRLYRGIRCALRSEEHTSELQSLMRISYAVFCLKKKKYTINIKKVLMYKQMISRQNI